MLVLALYSCPRVLASRRNGSVEAPEEALNNQLFSGMADCCPSAMKRVAFWPLIN